MNDTERTLFRDQGVIPTGWRWCPDCNGEGTISTMSAGPDLDETARPCTRCVAEHGIVPDERPTLRGGLHLTADDVDALRALLDLLDDEWGHLGEPQQGSPRAVLRGCLAHLGPAEQGSVAHVQTARPVDTADRHDR